MSVISSASLTAGLILVIFAVMHLLGKGEGIRRLERLGISFRQLFPYLRFSCPGEILIGLSLIVFAFAAEFFGITAGILLLAGGLWLTVLAFCALKKITGSLNVDLFRV